MKKVVNREAVQAAMRILTEQGEKVSARNILRITGGSMTTVLLLYRQAQEAAARREQVAERELPAGLVREILGYAESRTADATSDLRNELAASRACEDEILAALESAEETAGALEAELGRRNQERDRERQEAKVARAAMDKEGEALRQHVKNLTAEREELIREAEEARTATALGEAELRHEQEAAARAGDQADAWRDKYETLLSRYNRVVEAKTEAERQKYQEAQRAADLTSQLGWTTHVKDKQLEELKGAAERERAGLQERLQAAKDATARAQARADGLEADLRAAQRTWQEDLQKRLDTLEARTAQKGHEKPEPSAGAAAGDLTIDDRWEE